MTRNIIASHTIEAVILLTLSLLTALTVNAVRDESLPLLASRVIEVKAQSQPSVIEMEEARQLWEEGQAQFVDAREPFDHELGHIPGSINVPLFSYITGEKDLSTFPKDRLVVVYCESPTCQLAGDLAGALKDNGFTRVLVYEGGVEQWQSEGLPLERQQ